MSDVATPTDEWVWLVAVDGRVMERGSREHVNAVRTAYERACHTFGIVPAVTYIKRAEVARA